jgi:hypothetical protein
MRIRLGLFDIVQGLAKKNLQLHYLFGTETMFHSAKSHILSKPFCFLLS